MGREAALSVSLGVSPRIALHHSIRRVKKVQQKAEMFHRHLAPAPHPPPHRRATKKVQHSGEVLYHRRDRPA